MIPSLTIVIPILNEKDNIRPFYKSIKKVFHKADFQWEIIFVDDNSKDGTADEIRSLISEINDQSVGFIRRVNRFGLSSACIEGIMASQSPFIAVMDVDGQHDEKLLLSMYKSMQEENLDLVVGSRYLPTGSLGELKKNRAKISEGATYLAQKIGKVALTDPMSGFFMVRRSTIEPLVSKLFSKGFKILLDIFLASPQPLKYKELAYTMRARQLGESKLSSRVVLDYMMLLAYHRTNKWVPLDFLLFLLVGFIGAILHLGVLGIALKAQEFSFLQAQSLATLITMCVNFYFNNKITFYYQRLKRSGIWKGFFKFILVCSLGFAINLALSDYMYKVTAVWWLSGGVGFFISGVWNYLCSKTIVWKVK
jgi:dolichol-phosphate mannosyltransferase